MPSATSTKGVSCSVAGAGKVILIGSNCPASRVGRCVDCEGGRTAQIFSDCAITKYLSRATARRPHGRQTAVLCGRQTITIAAVESLNSEWPWTSKKPAVRPPSPRQSASIQAPAVATVLIGSTTVLQCCALLPACCCTCICTCGSYIRWNT